jgi:hypothetical protein
MGTYEEANQRRDNGVMGNRGEIILSLKFIVASEAFVAYRMSVGASPGSPN